MAEKLQVSLYVMISTIDVYSAYEFYLESQ